MRRGESAASETLLRYGRVQTSPRADMYSLGATLHQLLSGHSPTLNPFRFAPLLFLDQAVPTELEALIMQMVDLDENNRPASVAIVQQELQRFSARNTSTHINTVPLAIHTEMTPSRETRRLPPIGTTLVTYYGHGARVLGLCWSPDGKYIASASADKTVQVWEAETGNSLIRYPGREVFTNRTFFTYEGHRDDVRAGAWSPDGTRLASGGHDAMVRVWDAG